MIYFFYLFLLNSFTNMSMCQMQVELEIYRANMRKGEMNEIMRKSSHKEKEFFVAVLSPFCFLGGFRQIFQYSVLKAFKNFRKKTKECSNLTSKNSAKIIPNTNRDLHSSSFNYIFIFIFYFFIIFFSILCTAITDWNEKLPISTWN